MSNEPPNWDEPPASAYEDRGGGQVAQRGGGNFQRREPAKFDVADESRKFHEWLDMPATRTTLAKALPDDMDPDTFISTAKSAVFHNPALLNPELRASLFASVGKAAAQGLKPDGKEGALVPRYDDVAKEYRIAWQPMVWGITKLGRKTGAIRSIRAHIVFEGEDFEVLAGEDDRIMHRVNPEIVETAYRAPDTNSFLSLVKAAYCIITATDGVVTKRWMPRSRIALLRATSKAAKGPWNGPFRDEMILKGVILYTAKWIDLSGSGSAGARFTAALETDMAADFDADTRSALRGGQAAPAALPAPDEKLHDLEAKLGLHGVAGQEKMAATVAPDAGFAGVTVAIQADPVGVSTAGSADPVPQETPPTQPPPTDGADDPMPECTPAWKRWAAKAVLAFAECKTVADFLAIVDRPAWLESMSSATQSNPEFAAWMDRQRLAAYARVTAAGA